MSFKRNIASVYSAYLINGILSVVAVPLGLSYFGSNGYGLFAIYGVLTLCCTLLGMGLNKHSTRLLASCREPSTQCANLRIALGLYLTISISLLVLLPVLCLIVPTVLFPVVTQDVNTVRWLVVLVAIEYLLAVPTEIMQINCIANERIDQYSLFVVISGFYRYIFMFAGILTFGTPLMTVALLVARRLIDPLVAHRIMRGFPAGAWRPRIDIHVFGSFIRSSAQLSICQITQITMVGLGSVLANAFCGLNGLGLYRAAFDLTSRLWLISNGLGLVVFPRFSRLLATKNRSEPALTRISGILDLSWTGYIAICTIGVWLAPYILPIIGIPSEAVQLFMLLLLGTGMNAHGTLSYEFLLAGGKYNGAILIVTFATIVLAVTCTLLHGQFGLLTLGWAWIISQFTYAITVDIGAGILAGDSLAVIGLHTSFKIIIFAAAVFATSACIISTFSTLVIFTAIICLIVSAIALQGLRFLIYPVWEGHST
jgi:O-antigen/teichoic acid export membrane protein